MKKNASIPFQMSTNFGTHFWILNEKKCHLFGGKAHRLIHTYSQKKGRSCAPWRVECEQVGAGTSPIGSLVIRVYQSTLYPRVSMWVKAE
jgi:hypothetical protein